MQQQVGVIRQWCADNGYSLAHEPFTDDARSGGSTVGRDGFDACIDYLTRGAPVAGLVVWSLKRLARNLTDGSYFTSLLRRKGYEIYSIEENIPQGSIGKIVESLHFWMGEEYRAELSREVKRGHNFMASVHRSLPNGEPPAGLSVEKVQVGVKRTGAPRLARRLVANDKAPLVLRAFELRAEGLSFGEIHREVRLFHSNRAYGRMFRQRLYIGELQRGEQVYPDFCEPIVPRALWLQVQAVNEQQAGERGWRHPRRTTSPYILSGLLRCAICGRSLVGKSVTPPRGLKAHNYYVCKALNDNPYSDHPHPRPVLYLPCDELEGLVLDGLKSYLLDPGLLERMQHEIAAHRDDAAQHTARKLSEDQKELAGVTKEVANIVAAVRAARHSPALLSELDRLETRQAELKSEIADLQAKPPAPPLVAPADVARLGREMWQAIETARQINRRKLQLLLRSMLEGITVARYPDGIKGEMTIRELPGLGIISAVVHIGA